MNEFLPKELKDYIGQNQDTLVKLLDTLCRIPAPSNHEELRAEFIRDWFEKEGCKPNSISEDVLAEMKERVSTTWGEVESRVSPEMWEAYNAAIERAEQAYGIQ